jgi:hypothetical protein
MSDALTKVRIDVSPADWHSAAAETLWAMPLGANQFRLENSPFYAKGYSYLDVVYAEMIQDEGIPVVRHVVRKSGHSTYAIWVINGVESNGNFSQYWEPIEILGCSFEGVQSQLLSVDVPADVNVHEVYRLMQCGEDAGVWYFQEQDVGHAVA